MNSGVLNEISDSIVKYDEVRAKAAVDKAIGEGLSPVTILEDGLAVGMAKVGKLFDEGKIYIPQVVASSNVMTNMMKILQPSLESDRGYSRGCVVMGTVKGDIHEIGKNICCAMLRGAGYDVIDLGSDVDSNKFMKTVNEKKASILGLSALMTTTMFYQKEIIETSKGNDSSVKVIVGGAPCTQKWSDDIGADGYSASAGEVVQLVISLFPSKKGKEANSF